MKRFPPRFRQTLISILVLTACSQKPPDIQISDIIVLPSPVMKGVVSVFMKIENKGGKDYLIDARTDVNASIVEFHDIKDGKMIKVKDIKIPAKGKVEMIPGGIHIMIFNLPDNIMMGHEMNLYLQFKESGERSLKLKVLQKSA